MDPNGASAASNPVTRRVDAARRARERTAPLRCACYAAWSELTASPHDIDTRHSLRDKLGAATELGYDARLDQVIEAYLQLEPAELKRQYSGLFEVGSDGPPVPIREDLQTGQRAGTREDLVRFYDYFGYGLSENFAWQPDHLSVELEFMHFLCFREAAAERDWASYQLAQADFAERHLLNWIDRLVTEVDQFARDSLYARVLHGLSSFVAEDFAWQSGTIAAAEGD
ncbi:MAG: molecular chaperone TorD family protein [Gammaproteobacteria bacterium]|nr:molecular chaperone TorD family protein [Gammaproteobacteria bacterium]